MEVHMRIQKLKDCIKKNNTFLCVGLDTDPNKIPKHLGTGKDAILTFNKAIINSTKDYCCAFKLNFAFYENMGSVGYEIMQATLDAIPKTHFTIADAKRGDIGNTAEQYADSIFGDMNFDAVTLAPYMGKDAVAPFLQYEDRVVIMLALTSNPSAEDLQFLQLHNGELLFENMLKQMSNWSDEEHMMFVVGATKPEYFAKVRSVVPHHFLLVPGVGKQGGSLEEVCKNGLTKDVGLLVNSSRGIIYASSDIDYDLRAAGAAELIQIEMRDILANQA